MTTPLDGWKTTIVAVLSIVAGIAAHYGVVIDVGGTSQAILVIGGLVFQIMRLVTVAPHPLVAKVAPAPAPKAPGI